jgi:invasion protein IalB
VPACLTFKNGTIGNEPAVAVVLIEPAGHDSQKVLRITLPLGMNLGKGTRISIDGMPEVDAVYKTCVPTGCVSDYDVNIGLISRLKAGQGLRIQAVIDGGPTINFLVPLSDFKAAYESPPSNAAQFE